MKKSYIILLLILLFFSFDAIYSQNDSSVIEKPVIRKNPVTILREDIKSILDNPDLANAVTAVYVRSCRTGETIFKMNESKNLIPASLTKLLTTSAALNLLKPDFRYATKIYLDGTLSKKGVFEGNIIVRAAGDPSLSEKFGLDVNSLFRRWAFILDSIGIKQINGNLICDDRYFDNQYYAPGWCVDDLIYPYAAPIEAIAVYDNTVKITIFPGDTITHLTHISTDPQQDFIEIKNNVVTVSPDKPEEIIAERNRELEVIELNGSIPFDSTHKHSSDIEISVNDPVLYFLALFKQHIINQGINFKGALLDYTSAGYEIHYPGLKPVVRYYSPSLLDIISNINKTSNNLAAEMLLKTIGKEGTGEGSFSSGLTMVDKYCKHIGIPASNIVLYDGSGLSRYNVIQPKYLVDLLFKIYLSQYRDDFVSTLARPGREGTLKRRMTNSKAENRVFAKTGSMNNVSNLAGYVKTEDGETLAFAIMIMNHNVQDSLVQNIIDLICMRLSAFSRKG